MKARELLGWNVRRLRNRRGLSQEALAADAHIDRAHFGKIERGKANVTCEVLDKLAGALGASLGDLFKSKRPGARPPTPMKKGPKAGTVRRR